jgi:hypothetical protein
MCTATEECCTGGCAVTKVVELMPLGLVTVDNANCGACGNNCGANTCCCFGMPGLGETQCSCCSAGQTCDGTIGCQ